jgi:hypothetical protein
MAGAMARIEPNFGWRDVVGERWPMRVKLMSMGWTLPGASECQVKSLTSR